MVVCTNVVIAAENKQSDPGQDQGRYRIYALLVNDF